MKKVEIDRVEGVEGGGKFPIAEGGYRERFSAGDCGYSDRVREILIRQPLNPISRVEFKVGKRG